MVYTATRGTLLALGDDPHTLPEETGVVRRARASSSWSCSPLFDYRRLEPVAIPALRRSPSSRCWGSWPSGATPRASQRWFSLGPIQIQPSEFAVIGLIVAVAAYCDRRNEEGLAWKDVFKLLIMSGIPIGLVLIQPDLGTAIIMMIVLLVMLAVAGLPMRILVMLVLGRGLRGAGGGRDRDPARAIRSPV